MKKFMSFVTVLFLISSLILLLLVAVFDNSLYLKAVEVIRNFIWPAIAALLIFIIFLSVGIVSNMHRSDGSLISNGYFQVAIFLLFIFSAGLGYFWHYSQQPGNIVLRLEPEGIKDYVNIGLRYPSGESSDMDTVTAPGELNNRPAGSYSFEILDPDIVYFQANLLLKPTATETLVVPIIPSSKKLAVQTEPENAEIWIDGFHTANTPYVFEISDRDTVILELKMQGYQTYLDTLSLVEDLDLGVISLEKLFTLRISCQYPHIDYMIYDANKKLIFTAAGSRRVQLAKGRYRIAYGIGEGQYESKTISLNYNTTVTIP